MYCDGYVTEPLNICVSRWTERTSFDRLGKKVLQYFRFYRSVTLEIIHEENCFFDIDGTLTSEIDGSIPESAVYAIQAARANGNLMFINTGRCFQNVEQRFRDVGFDGFVCGCGTDIYCDGTEILHVAQTHETVMKLLLAARGMGYRYPV